ncbi:MAG TPA: Arc family DNA-binding protein [Bacteroidales bacterium]|nr:Arc family DNA-binding protein [Bacteroidales bacterium]
MSDKKPFVLRLDPEKLRALEKWAEDEFRSTNGQIEYILDQALRKSGRWKTRKEKPPEGSGD